MFKTMNIEKALYLTDVMGCCCVAFENYDEYRSEAEGIFERMRQGMSFEVAILETFKVWFDTDLSQEKVDLIINQYLEFLKPIELQKVLASNQPMPEFIEIE